MDNFLTHEYSIYMVIAVFSTALFFLKSIAMFFGSDGLDSSSEGNFDFDDGVETNSEQAFEILSFQSIVSFLMLFSWCMLGLRFNYSQDILVSFLLSWLAGAFGVFLHYLIYKLIKVINTEEIKDLEVPLNTKGIVYLTVKKNEQGIVNLSINDQIYELKAFSDEEEIASHSLIKVTKTNPLTVTKMKEKENYE